MNAVRALTAEDWPAAQALYAELTLGPNQFEAAHFDAVLSHPGTQVFGCLSQGALCSMATLHLLPNVTWHGRPYGLVENVVTAAAHRGRGYGKAVLSHLAQVAWESDAYKLMLMTGQKRGATGFYEACGFSSEDKFAMVMRRA